MTRPTNRTPPRDPRAALSFERAELRAGARVEAQVPTGMPLGWIQPMLHASRISRNRVTDNATRIASARAMRLSARPSSGPRRSMNSPAPASAASTSTRNPTITNFMTNDYSTDPAPASAGSSPPRHGAGSTRSRIVWLVVALVCASITAQLGRWQLSRAHAKLDHEALVAARGGLPPMPASALARDAATGEQQWERHIELTGE